MIEPPTAGDLDGDGRAEIVASTFRKTWSWRRRGKDFLSNNHSLWVRGPDHINVIRSSPTRQPFGQWPVQIDYPLGGANYGPGSVAIGDIDGDLLPDLVAGSGICGSLHWEFEANHYRCIGIYAYNRLGQLLPGFPKATPGAGSANEITPAIGDLDGDGLKEIVWIDLFGNIMVWNVAGTPAPEAMQWPMFRHDPAHTGALAPNP